ncbi:hypothetical protein AMELA_G00027100 [Ameiurus melas]|uniref:ST8 alpha-N-acetyl-neuraminide alpha-2,8-sialyltransferase 6 n=1 Tax=Ameiurus melas TaxID=219545 RepID=A0A7J6BDR5_AMEME|nr:hypothetical protein AMELA_G00027100 [Ameiurus melas]
MKVLSIRLLPILFFTSFCSGLLWHYFGYSVKAPSGPHNIKHDPPKSKENIIIDQLLLNYTTKWKKQEKNSESFRSMLGSSCDAISSALVTQINSPVGTNISYESSKKKLLVSPSIFEMFLKENPFKKAPWKSCAVVGNGGILANSRCGKQIDSAAYVIRCNLPPLSNGHERDTGRKTSLVTANPSLLNRKYHGIRKNQQSFVDNMQLYGNALLLLPAFSFQYNTGVSFRALYSLKDRSNTHPRAVFFNPIYLKRLAGFWRGHGIRAARLSSGIMMVSMALELCNDVHLFGFWPFETHPYTGQKLSNHYYDNQPVNKRMHKMPAEFKTLLDLHYKGVIHLHLGECTN